MPLIEVVGIPSIIRGTKTFTGLTYFQQTVNIATTNQSGIVFGSLGTATRGIDLSLSGLSGNTDYPIYISESNYWRADANVRAYGSELHCDSIVGEVFVYTPSLKPKIYTPLKIVGYSDGYPIIIQPSAAVPLLLGNATAVGSLTACTSNGTTTITKTSHGLSLAIGDLVLITAATTAADKGFYRLASFTVNTLVVDRALTGSDSDVALSVYKDVIGVFATDGTNGQRISGYSHQAKPLQIGGDVLTATGHSLTGKDVLIGNNMEVDGTAFFDGAISFGTYAAITTETLQGYITITDAAGNTRKLAVVS